jgi:hypothetical protein
VELERKFESLLDDLKLSIKTQQKENRDILTKEMIAIRVKELFELWKKTQE